MFVKGYCIEGQAKGPDLIETPGWTLNGQIQPRATGSCPTRKINMNMTRMMRSSGIRKSGVGLTYISDGALGGLALSLLRGSVLTRLEAIGCSLGLQWTSNLTTHQKLCFDAYVTGYLDCRLTCLVQMPL